MILYAITVRNYRIHRELRLDFDASRNVIGGPNESGKSTLMDAAHQCLFLKARIMGETAKQMQSWYWPGRPEVEIEFGIGDDSYRVSKCFAGPSGTTRLTHIGGKTWQGEEAEQVLAALLGVEDSLGGRGSGRASSQWAHVWVRQGKSSEDPIEHAETHRDALMARLQQTGGAVVLQSARDIAVVNAIQERYAVHFVPNGGPRKGSPLSIATLNLNEATDRLNQAFAILERMRNAAEDIRASLAVREEAREALPKLEASFQQVQERRRKVDKLLGDRTAKESMCKGATEAYKRLLGADASIEEVRIAIESLDGRLAPQRAAVQELDRTVKTGTTEVRRLADLRRDIADRARAARRHLDRLQACVAIFEATKSLADSEARLAIVTSLRTEMEKLDVKLSKLPVVKPKDIGAIEELEQLVNETRAKLEGMATGIDVIVADEPIMIDGTGLAAGESTILSEDKEIVIGNSTRLRVRPGGGLTLSDTRDRLHTATAELDELRHRLGVASAAEARNVRTERRDIESSRKNFGERLEEQGAESIDLNLAEARRRFADKQATLDRLRAGEEEPFETPATLDLALERASAASLVLAGIETDEQVADFERGKAVMVLEALSEKLAATQKDLSKAEENLQGNRARLQVLISEHGEEEPRRERLRVLLVAKTGAETELMSVDNQLAELQPEHLEADHERFQRSLDQTRTRQTEATIREGVARRVIETDGSTDPEELVAVATAAVEREKEVQNRAKRDAEAVRLLHTLLLDEQRRLAERFTGPLAQKITDYLQCVYGPGAHARVVLAQDGFSGIEIVRRDRGGMAMGFDPLSGGTKEQVAVATRLAIAEILAQDGDGHLPLVLDDAFAYSDRSRIRSIQRMLDLAAQRKLQIIVLTCSPEDYTELGASVLSLPTQVSFDFVGVPRSSGGAASESELSTSRKDEEPVESGPEPEVTEAHRAALLALLDVDTFRGNVSLRRELGWDEGLYRAVKRSLVGSGKAESGLGRGGSLRAVLD